VQQNIRCVGRTEEFQRLDAALDTLCRVGTGQLVLVSGEVGLGKTALAKALEPLAAAKGAQFRYGLCPRGEDLHPLGGLETIVADLCRDQRLGALATRLFTGRGLPMPGSGRPAVPAETSADGSSSTSVARVAADDFYDQVTLERRKRRRYALFDGVVKLFQSASTARPLVVALDDVQQADELLWEFLEYLAYDLVTSRVMIVCLFRDRTGPADQHERLVGLAQSCGAGVTEVEVRPLNADELAAMLAELYPGHRFGEDFMRVLFTESRGVPLVLEELCTSLEIMKVIYPSGDGWYNTQWSELAPGEGLEGTVYRRLGKLSEGDIDLLEFLAGLPPSFPLALLGSPAVAGYLGIQERTLLKRLCRLATPFRIFSLEGKACRLRLPFLRDTILSDIPRHLAERDSEVLAEGLESLTAPEGSPASGTIANAFLRGGNDERALHHLRLASDYLEAYGAAGAAVRVLLQSLEGLRHHVQDEVTMRRIAEAQVALAENFQLQGLAADAAQNFERAVPLLGALGEVDRRRRIELAIAFNRMQMGMVDDGEATLADRLGDEGATVEERVVAALLLGRSLIDRGEADRSMQVLKDAALLADRVEAHAAGLLARLLVATGDLWLERGDNLKADGLFREGLRTAPAGTTVRVDALCRLAHLAFKTGRLDDAGGHLMDALAEADQLSYLEGKSRATEVMASLKERDDSDEAIRLLHKAYGYVTKSRSVVGLQRVSSRLGGLYRAKDDGPRARFFLERSYKILQKLGRKEQLVQTGLVLGELVLKENQLYEAERHFTEAWQLAAGSANRTGEAFALYGLGKAFLAQRKLDKAKERFEQAKTVFQAIGLTDRVEMVAKELRLLNL